MTQFGSYQGSTPLSSQLRPARRPHSQGACDTITPCSDRNPQMYVTHTIWNEHITNTAHVNALGPNPETGQVYGRHDSRLSLFL